MLESKSLDDDRLQKRVDVRSRRERDRRPLTPLRRVTARTKDGIARWKPQHARNRLSPSQGTRYISPKEGVFLRGNRVFIYKNRRRTALYFLYRNRPPKKYLEKGREKCPVGGQCATDFQRFFFQQDNSGAVQNQLILFICFRMRERETVGTSERPYRVNAVLQLVRQPRKSLSPMTSSKIRKKIKNA